MGKLEVPARWVCQAYRLEVDRPSRYRTISSHEGAKRFAWNWALELIEHQLHTTDIYRVLALGQGATMEEAVDWSRAMVPVPWSLPSLRRIWNREKHKIAPWWSENSKECYSTALEALSTALKSYFDSRSGERRGSGVGFAEVQAQVWTPVGGVHHRGHRNPRPSPRPAPRDRSPRGEGTQR